MSESIVLLVTGSRALADRGPAEAWARGVLRERIEALPEGSGVLSGGCKTGPDAWSFGLANCSASHWVEVMSPDGGRVSTFGSEWWSPKPVHPLERNKALVARLIEFRDEEYLGGPYAVCVLGLVHPGSRTHGTDHTLGLARRAGLETERLVWKL